MGRRVVVKGRHSQERQLLCKGVAERAWGRRVVVKEGNNYER